MTNHTAPDTPLAPLAGPPVTPPALTVFIVAASAQRRDDLALLLSREGLRFQLFSSIDTLSGALKKNAGGCILAEWPEDGAGQLAARTRYPRLQTRCGGIPVVYLGDFSDVGSVRRAFRSGALDILTWPVAADELHAVLDEAFSAEKQRQRVRQLAEQRQALFDHLTPREREVAALAARGYSNPEIGQILAISPRTAEIHKSRALHKLGVTSLAQLIAIHIGPINLSAPVRPT